MIYKCNLRLNVHLRGTRLPRPEWPKLCEKFTIKVLFIIYQYFNSLYIILNFNYNDDI